MISDPHPVRSGLLWGLLGVLAFSFTVPFTRVAVSEGGLPPLFVGAGRAVVAALLAAIALVVTRQALPRGRQWVGVGVVALGVVIGFPVLTSFALTTSSASHGAVVIAVLPAATAVVAVWRTGERPPPAFWLAAAVGAVCAVAFAVVQGGGLGALRLSDLLLFGAVIAAAVGYAEGGLLSRELGAWQTISWALVVAAPFMLALTAFGARGGVGGTAPAWWSFAYLGVVSMFLGFFAWYRGLAIGPMASVSQVQLAQPVFGIAWAALLLGEPIGWSTVLGGFAVIAAGALAVRTRARPRRDQRSASNSRTVTKR
ncbi:carboxylate/amino acid/amine transporter (plasmid) [Tsukamurella tyrosinosolvens]|uniref:Permease of the drug/metabolite transporter (DMT) superfamily n=1 Tax=Tsukamurella tyrosinosolvens TaxID=57704 RepID=A0A1H5C1U6_TSUTY|nr:Permease of the drug/metabolite transporter (DMT) superfamily [Tsukamurella tyrosinosolvens]VEI01797.1 carboxylate/amino acid/amine transporter [Tsukamurella tyrosinosolvens]